MAKSKVSHTQHKFIGSWVKMIREDKGVTFHLNNKGKTSTIDNPYELGYKLSKFAQYLSNEHDVALTKFSATVDYKEGGLHYTLNIPLLDEDELSEMTVEEIREYFDEYGIDIIISDPKTIKGKNKIKDWQEKTQKSKQQLKTDVTKYYKAWKQG